MCRMIIAIALVVVVSGCSPDASSTGRATSPSRDKSPPPPCHPGCFPAGTLIATPDGLRRVEAIGPGDVVILVGPDGTPVGSVC